MRFLVVTAIVLACQSAHAQVIAIEFGPETPGAVDAGATAVKDALKLTKDPANKWKAVFAFQKIATDWPAALHDCYLSLAKLRVDELTEAKVLWDRAAARGGDRPKWCTGDLANQLAKALRDEKFVEITIAVTPADALVTWNGSVRVRGAPSLWVKQTPDTPFAVVAPGFAERGARVPLTATGGRLAVDLQPEPPPVVATPDAGVEVAPRPPPDGGVPVATTIVPVPVQPEDPDDRPRPRLRIPYRTIAGGVGILCAASTGLWIFMAHYESDKGNKLYTSDPAYTESKDLYVEFGAAAIVFGALSVASFVTYLALPSTSTTPALSIAPPATGRGLVFEYTGTFGGAR